MFKLGKKAGTGLLTLGEDQYYVLERPCDFNGRSFCLAKITQGTDKSAVSYNVFIGEPYNTCDCKGYTRFRYCKHCTALRDLIGKGLLKKEQQHEHS
jgi:hypothetical protein